MTLAIRRVTDAVAAHEALQAAAGTARAPDELAGVLAREDLHVLAAYDGDVPVGTVIAYELPRALRRGTGMLLYSIDVAAPHRRKGVGTALVAALRDLAEARGCETIWLLTTGANRAAMGLYARAGMRRPHPDDVMWEMPLGD